MVELVTSNKFLSWAAAKGIGRSPEYPHSPNLTFLSDDSTWYRYRPNVAPDHVASFVKLAARVAVAGGNCWLYPTEHDGRWVGSDAVPGDWIAPVLEAQKALGIPVEYIGAVHLDAREASRAEELVAVALDAGCLWSLTMIPDHARIVLSTDDDGDLIGWFPNEAALFSYTHALVEAGWIEPTEPDPRVSETDPWLTLS